MSNPKLLQVTINTIIELLLNSNKTKYDVIIKECSICKTKYKYTIGTYGDVCPNALKHKQD